jgi:exopolysaccharide biosynthesis polyprenyl glycosylphosphotransferase
VIRRYATEFRLLLAMTDGLIAVAAFLLASYWRFGADWTSLWRLYLPDPSGFLIGYALGWVTVLAVNGLYRPRARWTFRSEALDVLRATVVMAIVTLAVLFFFKLPDVSRLFLIYLFPITATLTLASRVALRFGFERLRRRGRNLRYVLILGAGPRGQAFAAKLEGHRELGLRVVGFLDDDATFAAPNRWAYLGPLERLETILHDQVIDEVVICLPFTQWPIRDAIVQLCVQEGKIVRIPIEMLDRLIATGKVEELDGTPVFSLVAGPDRALALAMKRLIDIGVAVFVLVLLSPLLIGVGAAIVLDGGRPILFRQVRVGLHGRRFSLAKFRTMVPDAEARRDELNHRNEVRGPAFKVTDDPRVTRIGRFLRRTSLDELPQAWNVLVGQMSLVGPRPPLPGEVVDYDLWHRRRLSMKPGITGLWQVEARRDGDFDRWVEKDLEYIDRWSPLLDLQILARTIPAVLRAEGR